MAKNTKQRAGISTPVLLAVIMLLAFGLTQIVQAVLLTEPDVIAAPNNLNPNYPTNEHQQAFEERQGVLLTSDLNCGRAIVPAGEVVDSHTIFFNYQFLSPKTDANRVWEFDGDILCVMGERSGLWQGSSDGFLGAVDTTYIGSMTGRGLETDGTDSYTIDGNKLTLTMTSEVPTADTFGGDTVRVITRHAVPDDTTPPTIFCEKGTSPGGKEQKDTGKDPADGHFFKLIGSDDTDGAVDLFITDTVSGTKFGPFVADTNIQILEAKGATPGQTTGSGAVEFKLKVNGPTMISATDNASNTAEVICSN